ncbi:MAG TPA: divalent metal cation transporter [Acetobacteraceae bacterium]|nr:divalent metal cation transporter [Acetobacteraceae bacterium]
MPPTTILAVVALLLVVEVPWRAALSGAFLPRVAFTRGALTTLVAVLGTTISPYLFFWQAAEEAEDEAVGADPRPLRAHRVDATPRCHASPSIPGQEWATQTR